LDLLGRMATDSSPAAKWRPVGAPNCKRCGKPAYKAESVTFDNHEYHSTCFKCLVCKSTLTMTGVTNLNGQLYCKDCFQRTFKEKGGTFDVFREEGDDDLPDTSVARPAEGESGGEVTERKRIKRTFPGSDPKYGFCAECNQALCKEYVEIGESRLHPECFCCFDCKKSFGENPASFKDNKTFCDVKCAANRTCSVCDHIIAGTVVDALKKKFHEDCFICGDCKLRLSGRSFMVRPSKPNIPVCDTCVAK